MAELITNNYQGANITIALTGLPMTITGEVIRGQANAVTLRLKDGRLVTIAPNLIAFFY
ncbi:hypothetical protein K5V21_10445 [Clostridium sardiniense]|uniref:Uncharacterized protein n=1 Tax=Clostridium sardiniense TaxID=29369 RepID=A0ABS7KZ60_CLOSR|nr:hypothetical protein [Clostridium sardiniense]MBY0755872.1 hypothetical protein [Clostridium sardiniense]MDQ0459897.1 hypothetical protein [Clostridium sardiniense]